MSIHRHSAATDGDAQTWTKSGPIAGPLPVPDLQRLQETQEATAAEPAPLGLFGFATGTFAIGYVLSGFAPDKASAQLATAAVLLALKLNAVFTALLAALVPGFALSGLGLLGEPQVIGHIGGYFLLLSALLAFYAASALVMNAVHGRTLLPLLGRA